MNDFEYIYMKQRRDFGRYCQFDDVEPKITAVVERSGESREDFVEQTVLNVIFDNIPALSEHSVNTARVQAKTRGTWIDLVNYRLVKLLTCVFELSLTCVCTYITF